MLAKAAAAGIAAQHRGPPLPGVPADRLLPADQGQQFRQRLAIEPQGPVPQAALQHLEVVEFAEVVLGLAQFRQPGQQGGIEKGLEMLEGITHHLDPLAQPMQAFGPRVLGPPARLEEEIGGHRRLPVRKPLQQRQLTQGRVRGPALPAAQAGQQLEVAAAAEGLDQIAIGRLAVAGQTLQGGRQALPLQRR